MSLLFYASINILNRKLKEAELALIAAKPKPKPNLSAFPASTSAALSFPSASTFSYPSSLGRPIPSSRSRPQLEVRPKTAFKAISQKKIANLKIKSKPIRAPSEDEAGNDAGDEGEARFNEENSNAGHDSSDMSSEDEGLGVSDTERDVSALIPQGDEELLLELQERQKKFEWMHGEIESRLGMIREGIATTDSVRTWIRSLQPTYGTMVFPLQT